MGWKNWSKGGIIATLIVAIILILTFTLATLHSNILASAFILYLLFELVLVIPFFITKKINLPLFKLSEFGAEPTFLGFLFTLIFYFLIGAIIGWIYGKIKSKNK